MERRIVGGRYELVRLIGQGATGTVWLARDAREDVDVALKLASSEVAGQGATRARFLREATIAATLGGANVARVLDHGVTDDGELFITMEHLVGTSLMDRLASQHRLAHEETCHIVSGACRGLTIAHEAGLVHRDIKPSNIFLQTTGDDAAPPVVKVLDFGSAKVTDWLGDSGIDPTRTGDLVGTPCYMSPEQARGSTAIDLRADLWAVGVVAFECMTGIRPFEARALGPLVAKILTGRIPTPSQAAPDAGIPPQVDAWMARALARNPEARPSSAAALADSLVDAFQAALEGTDASAVPRDESAIRGPWTVGNFSAAAGAAIAQYGPEIFRYLAADLGDVELANEAFSQFCESLFRALPRYEWRSSARTWAYTIARRCAVNVRRAVWRDKQRSTELTDSRVASIAQQVRSATLPFLRTARRTALLQLRDELPEQDKLLLVLRLERRLEWLDVARVVLDDENVDDEELHRASARLRKRYQLMKERLRERSQAMGLVVPELDDDADG